MGILTRGHLVETDRAGLVAEFAGQTAPKAHKKIDEARDGVLFIDEAYSLVSEKGDDPYGAEALQVLASLTGQFLGGQGLGIGHGSPPRGASLTG